jgi:hypothetical protein
MPQYLSPGVYVEEVPSAVKPIAGVGTSTAGFVGVMTDPVIIPQDAVNQVSKENLGTTNGARDQEFELKKYPVVTAAETFTVKMGDTPVKAELSNVHFPKDASSTAHKSYAKLALDEDPPQGASLTADYLALPAAYVLSGKVGIGDDKTMVFQLANYPVMTDAGSFAVMVGDTSRTTDATLKNDPNKGIALVSLDPLSTPPAKDKAITVTYVVNWTFALAEKEKPKLCTNFSEFKKSFGDFSVDLGQRNLAHAVYGFFNNGGARCYVSWVATLDKVSEALDEFAAIDEIAIVAVPGITDAATQELVISHCESLQDRFAILDGAKEASDYSKGVIQLVRDSNYGAIYFPWIKVFDPVVKMMDPTGDGIVAVPPSGHIAGVYARVDTERGVHKAPANEVIRGALDVQYRLSKAHQDGLNPSGVNVIRAFDSNIKIWGARTMGGDANAEFKYINVRRLLNFLRESIDEGTQWVVFEPNDPSLWAKITRNVTAFLTNVWRAGALFGSTPQEAFYVKCDAETNPPALRDLGQVVTEIGVSVVKPAEFVIFRISQWAGPGK